MKDIVEKLKRYTIGDIDETIEAAATEITSLRARVAELEGALEKAKRYVALARPGTAATHDEIFDMLTEISAALKTGEG